MKRLLVLFLTFVLALSTFAGAINPPKGFDKKLYDASFALYAESASNGMTTPRFLCTVTAYQRIPTGYLLLGAGHCTPANAELPEDMTFFIAHDINGAPFPVELIKASLLKETFDAHQINVQPVDYALFYLRTTAKLPTIQLGDESSLHIGSQTTNVNFSLGLAKYVAPGIVSSLAARFGEASGFFGVQMFMSHGASGSSVVDVKTHKIVGLVIAGIDGETVPAWIEPISVIEAQMKTLNVDQLIAHPDVPKVDRTEQEDTFDDTVSLLAANRAGHSGAHGSTAHPPAQTHPDHRGERHEGGRPVDRDTRERYFGQAHCFRPEIYYNGGFYSFTYAGLWFEYEDLWPYPADDVFVDLGPDGFYYMYSPAHPGIFVEVWVP